MNNTKQVFERILVATDLSPNADAALQQAVWLARQNRARLVLAHALPDLQRALLEASDEARRDFLYGEGERIQREMRQESDTRMRQMILDLQATDLDLTAETLLGDPFVALTHAVQAEHYDLLLAGTRGLAAWKQFLLGSTAKRLIRNCPADVWIVRPEHAAPPEVVLAATDFSDVSLKAVRHGLQVAEQANARFHLLHVIDAKDVPEDVISKIPQGSSLRNEINENARRRLDSFIDALETDRSKIQMHCSCGVPWKDIGSTARHLKAELIVMGTVGRSGIKGVLLGNTAEKVLDTCEASILTVKPDDFVSPVQPPFWPLHP